MNNLKYKNGQKIKYNDKPSSVWSLINITKGRNGCFILVECSNNSSTRVRAMKYAKPLGTLGSGGANLILSWLNKSVECCFYTSCYFHDGDGLDFYCATFRISSCYFKMGSNVTRVMIAVKDL
jgi:hypothetical protein